MEVKIIADSITECGDSRVTTFELEYQRFLHCEILTHRQFSKCSASSRAIPTKAFLEMIKEAPASPVEWGINQSGMQAKEVYTDYKKATAEFLWKMAATSACEHAKELSDYGLHKQIVNRVIEPFVTMKTVLTATEFENFFTLRCHEDAQPELHLLADMMYNAYQESTPKVLKEGEWHTPYGILPYWNEGFGYDYDMDLETTLKVSSSCCAQVSYRKLDQSIQKAEAIYDRLVTSKPAHWSPLEHCATPIPRNYQGSWEDIKGVTHKDKKGNLWSGNFKGWVQYRQLLAEV